jgi:hypothetical protein
MLSYYKSQSNYNESRSCLCARSWSTCKLSKARSLQTFCSHAKRSKQRQQSLYIGYRVLRAVFRDGGAIIVRDAGFSRRRPGFHPSSGQVEIVVDRFSASTFGKKRQCRSLNLGLCILLRVLDQVEGFPSNATLFNSFLLFYSNYPLHVSVVRTIFRRK